jgi:hypothetical protein
MCAPEHFPDVPLDEAWPNPLVGFGWTEYGSAAIPRQGLVQRCAFELITNHDVAVPGVQAESTQVKQSPVQRTQRQTVPNVVGATGLSPLNVRCVHSREEQPHA